MVCRDLKNGKILTQRPCAIDSKGKTCLPLQKYTVRTLKDLIVDAHDITPNNYILTKSTKTRSKRTLPRGSIIVVQYLPDGTFTTIGLSIRVDVPGANDYLLPNDLDFNIATTPTLKIK